MAGRFCRHPLFRQPVRTPGHGPGLAGGRGGRPSCTVGRSRGVRAGVGAVSRPGEPAVGGDGGLPVPGGRHAVEGGVGDQHRRDRCRMRGGGRRAAGAVRRGGLAGPRGVPEPVRSGRDPVPGRSAVLPPVGRRGRRPPAGDAGLGRGRAHLGMRLREAGGKVRRRRGYGCPRPPPVRRDRRDAQIQNYNF